MLLADWFVPLAGYLAAVGLSGTPPFLIVALLSVNDHFHRFGEWAPVVEEVEAKVALRDGRSPRDTLAKI
jgi:hypothetical protein